MFALVDLKIKKKFEINLINLDKHLIALNTLFFL